MSVFEFLGPLSSGYTSYLVFLFLFGTLAYLCWHQLSSFLDPAEPPELKAKVPYIGHILGIFKYHAEYYNKLAAESPMPISTLRMVTARAYLITSPSLLQNALRSKHLSFDPYMMETAQTMLGLSDEEMAPIRAPATADSPAFLTQFINAIHGSMAPTNLQQMNKTALNEVALTLNGLGRTFQPDSFFLWIRQVLTVATCNALLGSYNPIKKDPSLVDALWDFESSIFGFAVGFFPSIFLRKAIKARADIQNALSEYYTQKRELEPDVAQMTKARADVYKAFGFSPNETGKCELALIHVATTNAIPTVFWNLGFIFADPEVTKTIRDEISSIVTEEADLRGRSKRVIKIDITKFDDKCPVLVSSYRETIRLVNSHIGIRRVMEDTTISDGSSSYLLKKGADVMMPAGVTHLAPSTWGPDASSFNARRFLPSDGATKLNTEEKGNEKDKKAAYIPFGGGKHLCPGRNFAFAEVLGTVAAMVIGFDLKSEDGSLLKVPNIGRALMGEGVVKPRGEAVTMGVRIERREGWENKVLEFTVA